jgi:uncharacterized protein
MGGGRDAEALGEVLRADEEFMRIVHAVADVNPPQWAVGAGVVRDIVWDQLHGYAIPTRHRDVDVAYFDPTDLSPEYDRRVTGELVRRLPNIVWDAKNQAAVHTWYEARFGAAVDPLTSVEDAVGTWPETATAVAIRLRSNDELQVIAPCGLSDLFAMLLRRNPRRASLELFRRRAADKRITERWPHVQVIDG